MSQYYFLVTSLPALIPDAPPPMSRQQLLALCEAQMSASDYPMVREAGLDAEGRPAHSSDVLLLIFLTNSSSNGRYIISNIDK